MEHPSVTAYNHGCHCDDCRKLRSAYVTAWRRKKRAMVADGTWESRKEKKLLPEEEVRRLREQLGIEPIPREG